MAYARRWHDNATSGALELIKVAKTDWVLSIFGLAIGALLLDWYLQNQSQSASNDYAPSDDFYDPYNAPMSATTLQVTPMVQYAPSGMKTSVAGLKNIEGWEGRRNSVYRDPAGILSIGIGHRIVPGDGLNAQSTINDATVDAIFANDIEDAENSIKSRVRVPLSQGQFDALTDFVFQFGDGKFATSTLLALLNARDYAGAANQFRRWVNVRNPTTGQLVPVAQLQQRRNTAATMFV